MNRYSLHIVDEQGRSMEVYKDVQLVELDRPFPRIDVCSRIRDGIAELNANKGDTEVVKETFISRTVCPLADCPMVGRATDAKPKRTSHKPEARP